MTGHVHNMRVSEASDKSGTCAHTLALAKVRSNSRALDTGSDALDGENCASHTAQKSNADIYTPTYESAMTDGVHHVKERNQRQIRQWPVATAP
jgi:hypothetical protein